MLESSILDATPTCFDQVFTGVTGLDVNDAAFKAACKGKAQMDRGSAAAEFRRRSLGHACSIKH